MKRERERWTDAFGDALVAGLGVSLPIHAGTAWRFGRYILHIDVDNIDASAISVFAMEEPSEAGAYATPTDVKEFHYRLAEAPIVAANNVMAWLKDG
ncbi:MAG: hypothetical protein IAI50_01190 [Candidatus Eremiobacteraeota bacterium]|nr:hypothetical protein [Candidatus Eremiobacteraeota bacterium]